jgi:putative membrane protein
LLTNSVFTSLRPSSLTLLSAPSSLNLTSIRCKRRNLLESIGPAGYNALVNSLNGLVDSFTTCERLASTSIPPVYGIHLKQCTTLFLLTLPLVLVELMGFSMIPFVTVVAFTLTGIEAIASEIEMVRSLCPSLRRSRKLTSLGLFSRCALAQPFGIDDSDLPLDLFCAELRNEVRFRLFFDAAGEEISFQRRWPHPFDTPDELST